MYNCPLKGLEGAVKVPNGTDDFAYWHGLKAWSVTLMNPD